MRQRCPLMHRHPPSFSPREMESQRSEREEVCTPGDEGRRGGRKWEVRGDKGSGVEGLLSRKGDVTQNVCTVAESKRNHTPYQAAREENAPMDTASSTGVKSDQRLFPTQRDRKCMRRRGWARPKDQTDLKDQGRRGKEICTGTVKRGG